MTDMSHTHLTPFLQNPAFTSFEISYMQPHLTNLTLIVARWWWHRKNKRYVSLPLRFRM